MNQERTIMGACDYSIASLQNIKKKLMDYGSPQKEVNWAIGGIMITLTSHLLHLCHDTFLDAVKSGETDAKTDIKKIQDDLNEFINRMISNN